MGSVEEFAQQKGNAKPSTEPVNLNPGNAEEAARFLQAPHAARRVSKHQLEVSWAKGKRLFKDKPPYDEPLDGIWWEYCGYSPTLKLHLIGKGERDLFTGALLDEITGVTLPGGKIVLFSPNHQFYLAYEQPDGQDGETLKLYKRDGTMVWKGYNGILSPDGKSVYIGSEDMQDMRWDGQNRPQATVHLGEGTVVTVTLTEGSNGKWEWLPRIKK